MNEDKKNVPLDSEIKDEELDQVAGGHRFVVVEEDDSLTNETTFDLPYTCECGRTALASEWDTLGWKCPACGKPVSKKTRRSNGSRWAEL